MRALLTSVRSVLLVGGIVATFAACKKAPPPATTKVEYGEPIGVKLQGKKGAPGFDLALAVTKGKDPESVLEPLVGAVSSAIYACPDFLAAAKGGQDGEVAFAIEGGRASIPSQGDPAPSSPATACIAKGLSGKSILPDDAERFDVIAQIRLAKTASDGGSP
ncbi:MAG: hypothetical protein NVS3B20_15480 [Polyangiales bacterium]